MIRLLAHLLPLSRQQVVSLVFLCVAGKRKDAKCPELKVRIQMLFEFRVEGVIIFPATPP
jgi:hypothetical protein